MSKRILLSQGIGVSFLVLILASSCFPWRFCEGSPAGSLENNEGNDRAPAAAKRPVKADWKLGPAIRFKNLTVFPVLASQWPAADQFMTLDAGLKSGEVQIAEMGSAHSGQDGSQSASRQRGAMVNQLSIKNNSGKPLILLAGEMLLGGQQDRIDAEDRIVPASDEPMPLAVFCIEHGRWTGAQQFGVSARAGRENEGIGTGPGSTLASGGGTGRSSAVSLGSSHSTNVGGGDPAPVLATEAVVVPAGELNVEPGVIANNSVREKAEVFNDQVQVWDSVSATLSSVKIVTKSGSLNHAYQSQNIERRLKLYDHALKVRMGPNVVGVVVAVNGRVQLADIFASPSLFDLYWPKLLKSYELEAVSRARSRSREARIIDARTFLSPIQDGGSIKGQDSTYKLTQRTNKRDASFELEYTAGPNPLLVHYNRVSTPSAKTTAQIPD